MTQAGPISTERTRTVPAAQPSPRPPAVGEGSAGGDVAAEGDGSGLRTLTASATDAGGREETAGRAGNASASAATAPGAVPLIGDDDRLIRADPGVVIARRVSTVVHVTMHVPGSYGQPIPYVPVTLTDAQGRRAELATNDAGVITTLLVPGTYRVTTTRPVSWRGLRYMWDVSVEVARGMSVLDLNQDNATSARP